VVVKPLAPVNVNVSVNKVFLEICKRYVLVPTDGVADADHENV
jgi:hypothetical protein